jgi:hypothetical protein
VRRHFNVRRRRDRWRQRSGRCLLLQRIRRIVERFLLGHVGVVGVLLGGQLRIVVGWLELEFG